MNKLRVFEAFAGVGSQSMALRNIGINYEVVGTMDVDKWAIIAYDSIHNNNEFIEPVIIDKMLEEIKIKNIAYNFSTGKSEIPKIEKEIRQLYEAHKRNKNFGDIRLVDPNNLPDFDLFTYSFPCKNISLMGSQDGLKKDSNTQSSLVWECQKIIRNKKPKYLMMENVKNIVSKRHIGDFENWCEWLEQQGYTNHWKVLNGLNFGVPQHRERVIMISILNGHSDDFYLPERNNKNSILLDIIENVERPDLYIDRDKFKTLIYENNEGLAVRVATKLGYQIAEIGDSINIEQPNSKTRRGRVGKQRANTLNTGKGQTIYLPNGNIRHFTSLETWLLQGFSENDYYKAKNAGLPESKLYERAGRGIVIPMLEDIFKILFKNYNK